jgi:hypothetical protein
LDFETLNTVEKIANYTKQQISIYSQYPSKKLEVAEALSPIFSDTAEGWKLVVDAGRFRNGFTRVLGKRGMRNLKKILYVIDSNKWRVYFTNDEEDI